MKPMRSLVVSAAFFLIAVGVAVWLYPQLPAQAPMHWNLQGRIDGTMPRLWVAVFPAVAIVVVAMLAALLPRVSPHRFEIAPFARDWDIVMLAAQGMVLVIGSSVLLAGAGYAVPIPMVALLAVGALCMVFGNYMGKLRKNFFVGIRTPWTLASDAVWERTHRLAGWLFVLGGVVVIMAALTGVPGWIPIVVLIATVLVPYGYSYRVYRQLAPEI